MSTQYLMILCLMVAKLATLVDFRENIIPTAFWGHKVKITLLVFISTSSAQYSLNHLLDYNYLSGCSGCLREWIVHCIYATLLNFSNISCFFREQILFYLVQIEKKSKWNILLSLYRKRKSLILPFQSMKDNCFKESSIP